jgi:hypothetical protein
MLSYRKAYKNLCEKLRAAIKGEPELPRNRPALGIAASLQQQTVAWSLAYSRANWMIPCEQRRLLCP